MRRWAINSNEFAGFIAIDKPAGISSFDVIRRLRKLTHIRRIGHCGTLDPFATGLLVCCIGSFTRLAQFVEQESKTYSATIKLGEATVTGDTEAEVSSISPVPEPRISTKELETLALCLKELPVPAYSAVKINGNRAYNLARAGIEVSIPLRPVSILSFQVLSNNPESMFDADYKLSYRCTVSKGTYIRSLSEWLALNLGTIGHTVHLRREAIGDITLEDAVELDALTEDNWQQYILTPQKALCAYPSYYLNDEEEIKVTHGIDLALAEFIGSSDTEVVLYNCRNQPVAVGLIRNGMVHPHIVLA